MAYVFEWNSAKAIANARKHGVTFDEASTVFGDPLALLMPDHSGGEARHLLLGMSAYQRLPVVAFVERPPRTRLLSARRPGESGGDMKRRARRTVAVERDTLRSEYDFSQGVRGATASRYARGANIVVVDPKVLDVFPDGASVNEALRALAPVIRRGRRAVRRRRSA